MELIWFKSANMLIIFVYAAIRPLYMNINLQFLLLFIAFLLSTVDQRLSGRAGVLSVDYGQTKNGTPLFFSHAPAPCRYSNLLPPLTPPLWSMELKQGGREGPLVPIFNPTGAVSAQPWGLYFTGLQTWYPAHTVHLLLLNGCWNKWLQWQSKRLQW